MPMKNETPEQKSATMTRMAAMRAKRAANQGKNPMSTIPQREAEALGLHTTALVPQPVVEIPQITMGGMRNIGAEPEKWPEVPPGWRSSIQLYTPQGITDARNLGLIICRPGKGDMKEGYGILLNPETYELTKPDDPEHSYYRFGTDGFICACTEYDYEQWLHSAPPLDLHESSSPDIEEGIIKETSRVVPYEGTLVE